MKRICMMFVLLVAGAATTHAQQAQPARDDSPFGRYLFPPELIMQNQGMLELTERQRTQIRDEMQKAQAMFTELQWRMSGDAEKLERLLQANVVDEKAVLAQVDGILNLEREMKRSQIGLLVRIRNLLTEAQRTRLTELRR